MEALSASLGTALACPLGTAPAHLALEYMAPSMWASIGAMAVKLDGLRLKLVSHWNLLVCFKWTIQDWCKTQVAASQENYYKRIQDFKAAFMIATRALSGRIDNVELSLSGLSTPTNPNQGSSGKNENSSSKYIAQAESWIIVLETKLSKLISKGDEKSISFAGLGFQNIGDSNAWLEK